MGENRVALWGYWEGQLFLRKTAQLRDKWEISRKKSTPSPLSLSMSQQDTNHMLLWINAEKHLGVKV